MDPDRPTASVASGKHQRQHSSHHARHADVRSRDGQPRSRSSTGGSSSSRAPVVVSAKVVPQPGDGSCLFHSLCHGLGKGNAATLRQDICNYIAKHPNEQIAGATLRDWVKKDSGCNGVRHYASQMSSDAWGGGIEMAALSKMKGVNIHVYVKCPAGFQRISAFEVPCPRKTVSLLYQGRTHYDALEV